MRPDLHRLTSRTPMARRPARVREAHSTSATRRAPTPLPADVIHVWGRRLSTVAGALDRTPPTLPAGRSTHSNWLDGALRGVVDATDPEQVWLALAVLTGVLPDDSVVEQVCREAEFNGERALAEAVIAATTVQTLRRPVRVARGETVVDVSQTLGQPYTTGIQRVVRETATQWLSRGALPVSWTHDFDAIRACTSWETERVARKVPAPTDASALAAEADREPSVLVPWEGAYLTGEVLAERARSNAVRGLARYARCRTGAIGYDCVPIASAETLIDWSGDTYSWHLAALRHFDHIAAISEAAAGEFRGWRAALAGQGRTGPDIDAVLLPAQLAPPTDDDLAIACSRFLVADLPLVLVVGSTEPRKNHLAILHAAELLWREGAEFSLSFVGGRSWGSDEFGQRLRALQGSGRPVGTVSGITDGVLAAAYRIARFTAFPSLSEGYGLPVAESLALGTPVLTSGHGSMAEIAAGGGALLVNPRDDHDIASGMRRLLTDEPLMARLRAEAAARPATTWQWYSTQVWHLLMATPPDERD